jgi:beta-ketodecanoyl-[acyl-carrier-protein] synthase
MKVPIMKPVVISGTGLFTPPYSISNEELVVAFNAYAERFNLEHAAAIAAGEVQGLEASSSGFIEKASGIKSRYVMEKEGILDPARMTPRIAERGDDELSLQAEMCVAAARQALARAGRTAADIDMVLVACSNMQRPYPAMAVEVQDALGIEGYGFDMNVACSSATFGIQTAMAAVQAGQARAVLVLNPEITSAHLNFRDRDSHFIFGDACTALVVEAEDTAVSEHQFEILESKLKTKFSNNIRNNFGFMNRFDEAGIGQPDKLFRQQGRKVFKEVCPMAAEMIRDTVQAAGLELEQVSRYWLHQANLNMNLLIARTLLGRDAEPSEAPVILDTYANTSSAGSIIAFHKYQDDLRQGALGVICSFGAGYSIGCVVVRKK